MTKAKNDSLAWFRLYPGIVATDLMGMSLVHAGAYLRLHCLYWLNGMKLPTDDAVLYRKVDARTEEEKAAVQEIIAELFPVDAEGKHSNTRLDEHLEAIAAFSDKQRGKAKASWEVRRQASPKRVEPEAHNDGGDF